MTEFNREAALRLVLGAIRPHLDLDPSSPKTTEEAVAEGMKLMAEEPHAAAAFESAARAVYDVGFADGKGDK